MKITQTNNRNKKAVDFINSLPENAPHFAYIDYPPGSELDHSVESYEPAHIRVTDETTTEALATLPFSCGLNFASAKRPGGGFLDGSVAQEEMLCYETSLYASIAHSKMYLYNQDKMNNGLYTDYMIYSPHVQILGTNQITSIITSPAVNNFADNFTEDVRRAVMQQRMEQILNIALAHEKTNLVLGAWGCGIFKNDPTMIAEVFAEVVYHPSFYEYFDNIIFAIPDKNSKNYKAFKEVFN
ncbi:MAG: TIGR02452 family protein [Candidatus Pacearchaeota archaeon]